MAPKTMGKHTKGEWRVGPAVGTATIAIMSDGGIPLAYVAGHNVESQANACLMASAKDMLTVLLKWQAFMLENYTHGDLSWFTETNNVIDHATGKFIPPSWRAALPDLARPAAIEAIESAIRPFIYKPSGSHLEAPRAGYCQAAAHDDFGAGFHQCGRKSTRNLFGALVCQQHYRKIRAGLATNRAAKA